MLCLNAKNSGLYTKRYLRSSHHKLSCVCVMLVVLVVLVISPVKNNAELRYCHMTLESRVMVIINLLKESQKQLESGIIRNARMKITLCNLRTIERNEPKTTLGQQWAGECAERQQKNFCLWQFGPWYKFWLLVWWNKSRRTWFSVSHSGYGRHWWSCFVRQLGETKEIHWRYNTVVPRITTCLLYIISCHVMSWTIYCAS
jgi:hypothetical protein